jgi:hypothetical protein
VLCAVCWDDANVQRVCHEGEMHWSCAMLWVLRHLVLRFLWAKGMISALYVGMSIIAGAR